MGFNTSGIPKITVSLILNNPGTSDKKAIALLSSRFEKIYIAITSPRVAGIKTSNACATPGGT